LLRIFSKGCGNFFLFLHKFAITYSMLSIFLSIVTGIVAGYLLRNRGFVKYVSTFLSVVIMLLLFFLGVSVGINQQVVNNFATIGMEAFILTVGGTLGSLLCAKLIYRMFFKKKGK